MKKNIILPGNRYSSVYSDSADFFSEIILWIFNHEIIPKSFYSDQNCFVKGILFEIFRFLDNFSDFDPFYLEFRIIVGCVFNDYMFIFPLPTV